MDCCVAFNVQVQEYDQKFALFQPTDTVHIQSNIINEVAVIKQNIIDVHS
jgi:hypothetical protein